MHGVGWSAPLELAITIEGSHDLLPATPAQSAASRDGSGDMEGREGSQAALDSPGAQYRRLKQQEQEQRGADRQRGRADGSAAGSARSSGDGSAQSGGYDNDGGSVHVTVEPRQVPGSRAAASGQLQRVPGGGSPPAPEHAGSRGRGVLAFAAGDGTRAMALAARFDSIVAGGRVHHGASGPRSAGDSQDVMPSPSPLRSAGW